MGFASCSNQGETLKDFKLEAIDGNFYSNADLLGKTTLITVYATWCGPCVREIPDLNALKAAFSDFEDVQFWALNDEAPAKVNALQKLRPLNFVLFANANALSSALQTRLVKTYPQHVIIDKNGSIAYELTTEDPKALAKIKLELQKLVQ